MSRKIECEVCGNIPDCPQLKDRVWAQIASPDTLLCLTHAEIALGRDIEPDDLSSCPANMFALVHEDRSKG